VLRHSAAPMLYNDAMWSKYEIGRDTKTTDSRTRKPALRNTFWQAVDAKGIPSTSTRPSATIKSLMSRGVSFIGCDLATRGYSYALAQTTKSPADPIYEELKANLVPGAILMPTGVFATLVAQEVGCSFIKST
jgi:hypothetical protein